MQKFVFVKQLSHRSNAILLGDHLGDAQMSRGMPHVESVLKIGFLNEEVGHCHSLVAIAVDFPVYRLRLECIY